MLSCVFLRSHSNFLPLSLSLSDLFVLMLKMFCVDFLMMILKLRRRNSLLLLMLERFRASYVREKTTRERERRWKEKRKGEEPVLCCSVLFELTWQRSQPSRFFYLLPFFSIFLSLFPISDFLFWFLFIFFIPKTGHSVGDVCDSLLYFMFFIFFVENG